MQDYDRSIIRLLDANMNRAAEGLRVLEESARMLFDDAGLSANAKEIRHALAEAVRSDPSLDRLLPFARDAEEDVLKAGMTPSENTRVDIVSLLRANAKRTTEAIRALEEYGKLLSPALGSRFKDIRFAVYTLEQRLVGMATRSELTAPQRLRLGFSFMVSQQTSKPVDILAAARDLGAGYVSLNGGTSADRTFNDIAIMWAAETRKTEIMLFIEHRLDIALASGADGLFVSSDDISTGRCRHIGGGKLVLGYSVEPDSFPSDAPDDIDLFVLIREDLDKLPNPHEVVPPKSHLPFVVRGSWSPEQLERADLSATDGLLIETYSPAGTLTPLSLSSLRPVLERIRVR